jgi:hypothetical protein
MKIDAMLKAKPLNSAEVGSFLRRLFEPTIPTHDSQVSDDSSGTQAAPEVT